MVRHGNPEGPRPCAGRTWRRLQAQVYASTDTCWICGKPVQFGAHPRSPAAPSVDHVIPRSLGGDPLDLANLRLAHLGCNSARGNRLTPRREAGSRKW